MEENTTATRARTFEAARRSWTSSSSRFPVVFLALLAASWLAYTLARPGVDAFQTLTVLLVTAVSNAMGLHAASRGSVVSFGGGKFAFDVEEGCTGIAVAVVLCSAIWAYPAPRRARVIGVLVAAPLVLVVNVIRLVSMGWAGTYSADLFDWLHYFAWQIMVVLIAGFGFFAWARLSDRGSDSIRQVALEVAKAGAVFALVFVPLWIFGHYGGVVVYSLVFRSLLETFPRVLGSRYRYAASSVDAWLDLILHQYFAWAGFFGLFLATPRMTWKRRVLGAALLLTPLSLASFALYATIDANVHFAPLQIAVLNVLTGFGVPLLAWLLWARLSWKRRGLYSCPACAGRFDEIIEHVKTSHPIKTGKLLDRIRREHPELAR